MVPINGNPNLIISEVNRTTNVTKYVERKQRLLGVVVVTYFVNTSLKVCTLSVWHFNVLKSF